MKSLSIAILLTLVFAGITLGQPLSATVAKVRQIKLLESTRDDVKRILREYEATGDSDHYERVSNEDLRIEVTYSSGTCSEYSDEEDASDIWNVKEGKVTRIEIELSESLPLRDARFNLAAFKKEPRYPDATDSLVFHDKTAGFAFKTLRGGIETLIFFPARGNSNKLCRTSTAAKGFYKRKGWFSQAKPDDTISESGPAGVTDLTLSADEVDSSSTTTISVKTVAIDPENDALVYKYTISAGKIVGTGANVTWDLSNVSPGSYTITAGVDDGCGLCGSTMTRTVVVK